MKVDGRSHHPMHAVTILFWCRDYIRYVLTQPGNASLATHWTDIWSWHTNN